MELDWVVNVMEHVGQWSQFCLRSRDISQDVGLETVYCDLPNTSAVFRDRAGLLGVVGEPLPFLLREFNFNI
jgi:hypothetical protein